MPPTASGVVLLIISFFAFRPAGPVGDQANDAAPPTHSEINESEDIMSRVLQSTSKISGNETGRSRTLGVDTSKYVSRAKRIIPK